MTDTSALASSSPAERKPTFRFEIFLIALAAIVLEIGMTRIFSFKLYYYFTYLILGIAMLGLGAGGVFVAIFPALRALQPRRLVAGVAVACGFVVPLTYLIVALVQVNVTDLTTDPLQLARLFLICFSLFLPFLMIGVMLATIFGARSQDMNKLYFADLLGAGTGCALCIPIFLTATPPGAVMVAAAILAISGALLARGDQRPLVLAGGVAAITLLLLASMPRSIPDPIPDRLKTMSPQKRGPQESLHSEWSAVFRVDVMHTPGRKSMLTLHHDGNIGSSFQAWDGKHESLLKFYNNFRSLPFSVIDPKAEVLIIGAAGGQELQASVFFESGHVTGVELNPVTYRLLSEKFAEYTGNVAHHPSVELVNGEGRSFLERSKQKYDLIWLVAPDSYAAMNAASSGAYVLSESYLYTVEMVKQALAHLKPNGIIAAQFGELGLHSRPNRTPRYIATVRQALVESGVADFRKHLLVSTAPAFVPGSTILVSRSPFDAERLRRFHEHLDRIDETKLWYPYEGERPEILNAAQSVIDLDGVALEHFRETYGFNMTPVRDDSPFFWHFTSFERALFGEIKRYPGINDFEVATGERMLVILLVFATAFAAIFILLPTVKIHDVWQEIPHKLNAGIYFASLGLGFMFIEVCLIQKLTLFLGYPSYSLTVTLFSILIFSGIGSLVSSAYSQSRNRALFGLLAALLLITLAMQFALGPITDTFNDSGLATRIAVAIALLAPVGLCLGAFMPIGVATITSLTEHDREYVAWGWAVNGFFSVVSSVSATMLSMTFGFRWVLMIAFVVYTIGIFALSRIPEDERAAS